MDVPAAFFRLEHGLADVAAWQGALALAGQAPGVRQRLRGLAGIALALPLAAVDPGVTRDVSWRVLEGLSEDRLEELGGDFARDVVLPRVRPVSARLVREARAQGRRLVLVSESLTSIARPVAEALGFDHLLANTMRLRGAEATGELEPPVVGAELDPKRLRAFAARHGLDLSRSSAFAGRGGDGLLLSAVGLPCAIDPDRTLGRIARELDWPIARSERAPEAP